MPEPLTTDLREQLTDLIARDGLIHREKLVPDATMESIGMASYDLVMVLMAIEEKYGVYITVDTEMSEAQTFSQLLDVLVRRIEAGAITPPPADVTIATQDK